eukprot:TRINITY_DN3324_c0_g6_i3.p1 TRINITY_DN3324_c0_g6~~TRINITY_DN3324_c0_g6_i3.p1  ORF type:complete len:580 (-),score=113.61 TRINITY_DN3324_c0_g6_i3:80-1819(-)
MYLHPLHLLLEELIELILLFTRCNFVISFKLFNATRAHMWFGNLVSPVWWDGLWLNESFATYMAALCTAEATSIGSIAWNVFNGGMKKWAYESDQKSTTHPIQGVVNDTNETFLNFDGITYGKGASLLKQLVYVVGIQDFRKGMETYFKKYEWGNTTIDDFLAVLSEQNSHFDNKGWSKEWLETSGTNSLEIKINVDDQNMITDCWVEQGYPEEHPHLRTHHCELALFDNDCTIQDSFKVVVLPQEVTPIPQLIGKQSPPFVYLNNNDYAFAKILLDQKSQDFCLESIDNIDDSLLRQLLWDSFYILARDAKMKPTKYLELVKTKLIHETEATLVENILRKASAISARDIPKSIRIHERSQLFDIAFSQLFTTTGEFQIIWTNFSITFASTIEQVEQLTEQLKLNNPVLSQNNRWKIILKSIAFNCEDSQILLETEQETDKTDIAKRNILSCNSSAPSVAVKEAAWNRYFDAETTASYHELESDMSGFNWFHQSEILEPYKVKYFDSLVEYMRNRTVQQGTAFFYNLFPRDPEDPYVLIKCNEILEMLDDEKDVILKRKLTEAIDSLKISIKCIKLELE